MTKPKIFNKRNWIISQLRRTTFRYPPAIEADSRNKEIYYIPSKTGKMMKRLKWHCEICGKQNLKTSEKNRDHVKPVVGPEGFIDWNNYLENFYCDTRGFQTICISCHDIKTKKENQGRKT